MTVVIDSSVLIFLSIAFVGTITTISVTFYLKGKNKVQQDQPKGVKRTSKEGQEDFVEDLRGAAAETIAFLQDEIKRLKGEIKSKNGQIAKLNGLMYGTNDPSVIAQIEQDNNLPVPKQGRGSKGVGSEQVEARMQMIRAAMTKNNVNPIILEIPELSDALENIASSPNFDRIAATILQTTSQVQPASTQTPVNDL